MAAFSRNRLVLRYTRIFPALPSWSTTASVKVRLWLPLSQRANENANDRSAFVHHR